LKYRRIEADISLDAIRNNIETLRKINPDKKALLVIKADAYGHGAVTIAKEMDDLADYFGVACIDEAEELRNAGIEKPILILGVTDEEDFDRLITLDITQAVFDPDACRKLSERAVELGKKAKVHLKVDSGMSRIGLACTKEGVETALSILDLPGLNVEGIFQHYAKADEIDKTAAKLQLERYSAFVETLQKAGAEFVLRHAENSAAAMEFHEDKFDMMRLGIVIYGLYPSEEVDKSIKIYPAMTLKSRITHIKMLPKGQGISYGWTFVTDKEMRVATVSAGYADGYPRAQSGIGHVLVCGKKAPILGRVCMDQFMIDVTDIPEAKVRDEVVLIGTDKEETISVEEVAAPAASFNYELVCNVARRVPRVYFKNGVPVSEVNYLV